MAIDARIPLSSTNQGGLGAAIEAGKEDKRQNQLFEFAKQDRETGIARQTAADQAAALEADNARAREMATRDAIALKPLLESGDAQGALQVLGRRSNELQQLGKDTTQTQELIQRVQSGDLQGSLQEVSTVIEAAERFGEIKPQGGGAQDPSAVREFNFFQGLSPDAQEQYLQVKRSNGQIVDVNGVPNLVNKETGSRTPLSTQAATVDAAATEAGAVQSAKSEAANQAQVDALPQKTQAQAKIDLPAIEDTVDQGVTLIDDILDDPGLPSVIGFLQGRTRGLTGKQRGLVKKIEQVQGKVFLDAFERLKGGGQITELEGQAATNAQARINDRTQDMESFTDAMLELRETMETGLGRARTAAGEGDDSEAIDPALLELMTPEERALFE